MPNYGEAYDESYAQQQVLLVDAKNLTLTPSQRATASRVWVLHEALRRDIRAGPKLNGRRPKPERKARPAPVVPVLPPEPAAAPGPEPVQGPSV